MAIMIPAGNRGIPLKSRRRLIDVAIATMLAMLMAATAFFASNAGQHAYAEVRARSPQTILRYAQRRLEGHEVLEWLLLPGLRALQARLEREPPPGPLPTLGKGQQLKQVALPAAGKGNVVRVDTATAIAEILLEARPGTHIVIAPGHYRFEKTLRLGQHGRASAPITVTAIVPGSVRLDFSQEEGILIDRPHWTFENLNIRGICARHRDCEHAFHVVGAGAFTTLLNNHVQDFNAHIKVNGLNGQWPDHGMVAFNTLTNTAVRHTDRPVVTLDLVGANQWKVQDNLVTNFAKTGGHRVAYGLFMKGASEGGRIERNLVICSPAGISDTGERVGISFGGGGTDPAACRTDGCRAFEHRQGLAANNIVAHCNDAGIDVNHASQVVLAHNTLINTAGFSIRGGSMQARLFGNLYEGRISALDETAAALQLNMEIAGPGVFTNPDLLLLDWFELPQSIPLPSFVTNDFKNTPRQMHTLPGALERDSPAKSKNMPGN